MKVKIEPSFGDEEMKGEFDDDAFMEAEENLQSALYSYIGAGARSENLESAISKSLEDLGIG